MVWFYARDGEYLRCEFSDPLHLPDMFLTITHPDGTVTRERFSRPQALIRRQRQLLCELKDQGWMGPYGRPL